MYMFIKLSTTAFIESSAWHRTIHLNFINLILNIFLSLGNLEQNMSSFRVILVVKKFL